MTVKVTLEQNTHYYESGFSEEDEIILCKAIDAFGSDEHPCAFEGVGLKGFGADYIIEVCNDAISTWEKYDVETFGEEVVLQYAIYKLNKAKSNN